MFKFNNQINEHVNVSLLTNSSYIISAILFIVYITLFFIVKKSIESEKILEIEHEDYLLYQPLPVSSQKALDDFLTTFKDLDASRLSMEKVLPKKWLCAYQRTLCRAKKQENTRN